MSAPGAMSPALSSVPIVGSRQPLQGRRSRKHERDSPGLYAVSGGPLPPIPLAQSADNSRRCHSLERCSPSSWAYPHSLATSPIKFRLLCRSSRYRWSVDLHRSSFSAGSSFRASKRLSELVKCRRHRPRELRAAAMPNPSIERTAQSLLRSLWAAAHVER